MVETQGCNFYWPIRPSIANSRVKLIPFNPDIHASTFVEHARDHPEMFAHMPLGPLESAADLHALLARPDTILSRANPNCFQFAVIDRAAPPSRDSPDGALAGSISYIYTSAPHLSSEIGFVAVLPPYQGKGVASSAVALLMQYGMAPPARGGLGLRRLHWHTSTTNKASQGLAAKMGFKTVGTIEWHFRFPKGKLKGKIGNGRPIPPDGDQDDLWRDTLVYSFGWDQWENGARQKVTAMFGEAEF
ncbi:uncharacterized protein E0L32_006917 [Thyridium curvatum]|uniref:N-acetyltransferase domain-containing protein n=1 Tax=Thyridium curvatum TaxID=1093900 RepID=A0A507B6K4_9PEZI|nr:uncharacterized protein E0L32_006917 [Thyridium curvatum]TPX12270.1 hypothetical protein E0L32_006917 [Thyridium curvatum]